jgi:hypothetical protein
MKYSSLKRQGQESFNVKSLDGGVNTAPLGESIADNEISDCLNMWYNESALETRPGFKADRDKVFEPQLYGYSGDFEYKITDSIIYLKGAAFRVATADILTDDYAHYTYVYLIDSENNITPIGNMAFLRLSSDIFFKPKNITFFSGKSQGGGIFALVTLQNEYDYTQKNYLIYEINADYTEWERVYDYYVPTIFINGRGNQYNLARTESGISLPDVKMLESQNILNGRFNVYFTSDGYSSSFKLPFANLSSEKIVCRIYYTFVDYTEWEIPADANTDTKAFFGKDVRAVIDREKGVLYFVGDDGELPIPVMSLYNENNIKITATKEIPDGFSKIVHSTCFTKCNTKLILSGGADGNRLYISDSENPLYFPQSASLSIGDSNSNITALSSCKDKIIAFKGNETYLVSVNEGKEINEITLLIDNDKIFKSVDELTVKLLSKTVGCANKNTLAVCGGYVLWLGADKTLYCYDISSNKGLIKLSEYPKTMFIDDGVFATGSDRYYMLFCDGAIAVFDLMDIKNASLYLWQVPEGLKIESGFYWDGEFRFLSTTNDKGTVFISTLTGEYDTVLYYDEDDTLSEKLLPIQSRIVTKSYTLGSWGKRKNIDNIQLLMAARGNVIIKINGREAATVNFDYSNDIYGKHNYQTVKLLPHIYGVTNVCMEFAASDRITIGGIEFFYRVIG